MVTVKESTLEHTLNGDAYDSLRDYLAENGQEVGTYYDHHWARRVYHINQCTLETTRGVNSSSSIGLGTLGRVTREYKNEDQNVYVKIYGVNRKQVLEEILRATG